MYNSDATAVFHGQSSSGVAIDCIDFGKICKLPLFQCESRRAERLWLLQ